MKNVITIPGLPIITQTGENHFEVTLPGKSGPHFWFETLQSAIVFAIGITNERPDDFVRSAAYLLGTAEHRNP